jgi:drug/metabolite transporter (DMT)-like permease
MLAWELGMNQYLPGAILAACGVLVYAIGCLVFLAQRRLRGREGTNKLFLYAITMIVLGIVALGAGLFALETAQFHMPGN